MLEISAILLIGIFAIGTMILLGRRSEAKWTALLQEQNHQNALAEQQREKMLQAQIELWGRRFFDDSQKSVNENNSHNLKLLLEPFKEKLRDFEKKVEETYSQERTERGTLRGELNKMMDLNQKMSTEASNLTKALKGDVKIQGTWGEMVLENILERSGLRKNEEYLVQEAVRDESGNLLRPDVVVRLPDQKHIVVDSKMSLLSYEEYSRATTADEQERWARAFLDSLKAHIQGLSAKKYQELSELGSPDFVMLFMPLEPAFALAFKLKPDLLSEAWEKNIALVSPTTLLTTLRTVGALWKQDRQEKNALEIAKRGGLLYDKFALLVKDFEAVQEQMNKLQKSLDSVDAKLFDGTGNLISQVEKLRELGAKAEKRLPPSREKGLIS